MKTSASLALGGFLVALISFAAGAGTAFWYLTKPMETIGFEFSEGFFSLQTNALRSLARR